MERQYKDSGIPWMKQIPSDWDIIRGKNLLNLMNRPVREDDDVVTCFRDGEVILRSERRTEGFTMSDKEIGYQGINKGDIVIHGMDGFAGSMGISKSTGKGSPVLIVCNPKSDDDANQEKNSNKEKGKFENGSNNGKDDSNGIVSNSYKVTKS